MSSSIVSNTYRIPLILGLLSSAGLIAALLVDGALEWLALAAIAAPLVVVAGYLRAGGSK